jgi:type IV secretion system protein VirD4
MPAPSPFKFGYYYDQEKDVADKNEVMEYDGELHILLFGRNGSGKSTRILVENLVTLKNRSLIVFDPKGELAAQTHRARRKLGGVKIIDPFGVLKGCGLQIESDGYNPLALLDPADELFYDKAKSLTLAIIDVEGEGNNKFFPETAQGLFCVGIMFEVVTAAREGRTPSLLRARRWCLEPDQFEKSPDGQTETLVAGIQVNAKKAVAEGGQLADLAARFADESPNNRELKSVLSTLATQTEFLVSIPIARDLEKGGWSFAQLKEQPTTVYLILPPNEVGDKRRWTRLLVTAALHEHLKTGPMRTLFIFDEFRMSVGKLAIINDFWALTRGYGVQFMPVCQSVTQLKALFGDEWENYAGQSGIVATIGAPNDLTTAEWMSKRSGTQTVWVEGWSEGQGTNMQGTSSNLGETRSQAPRPVKLPQELMSMKDGTGCYWKTGQGDLYYPFFAPNYWDRPAVAKAVDANPYYRASSSGGSDGSSGGFGTFRGDGGAELTRAARGAGFIASAVYIFNWWFGGYEWSETLNDPVVWVLAALAGLGLMWFITGARRSWGFRDARIIKRCIVKAIAGAAIWYLASQVIVWSGMTPLNILPPQAIGTFDHFGVVRALMISPEEVLTLIAIWMIATGATKGVLYALAALAALGSTSPKKEPFALPEIPWAKVGRGIAAAGRGMARIPLPAIAKGFWSAWNQPYQGIPLSEEKREALFFILGVGAACLFANFMGLWFGYSRGTILLGGAVVILFFAIDRLWQRWRVRRTIKRIEEGDPEAVKAAILRLHRLGQLPQVWKDKLGEPFT